MGLGRGAKSLRSVRVQSVAHDVCGEKSGRLHGPLDRCGKPKAEEIGSFN